MSKKRKRRRDKQTAMELPERLALTTLPLDPSSVLGVSALTGPETLPPTPATGDSDPLSSALSQLGTAASTAQQTAPGATAQNIASDGATSTATAPPTTKS